METKTKKQVAKVATIAKVKEITSGANVKKVESDYKLMLSWHKHNKSELFSLSGAIKNLDFSHPDGKRLLFLAKVKQSEVIPTFILKNITKVKGFTEIEGKVFQSVYRNKVKTDIEKTKWSLWDIVRTIRAAIPE